MGTTNKDLESVVHRLFDYFDALDFDGIRRLFTEDVQGVDEISRGWLRGRSALDGYFAKMKELEISDVKTAISDLHARSWGDIGIVTLMADQVYRAGGSAQHVTAPTTVVLRATGDEWRIALVHAVGLPAEDAA